LSGCDNALTTSFKAVVVIETRSNCRSDEQLEAILFETGQWVVNGQQGQVLCFAASLGRAIDRAAEFAISGAVVVAIRRIPPDDIIVFPGQIERLRKLAARHRSKPRSGGLTCSAHDVPPSHGVTSP
jgi:hypothetical protein